MAMADQHWLNKQWTSKEWACWKVAGNMLERCLDAACQTTARSLLDCPLLDPKTSKHLSSSQLARSLHFPAKIKP